MFHSKGFQPLIVIGGVNKTLFKLLHFSIVWLQKYMHRWRFGLDQNLKLSHYSGLYKMYHFVRFRITIKICTPLLSDQNSQNNDTQKGTTYYIIS